MNYYIHPLSEVKTNNIGADTRVWQFSVIFPGAKIGKNCNICAHTLIENNVVVGDNVTIKSGVYLWDGIHIEDNVFIGPNATFTNDKKPRSKHYLETYPTTLIEEGASIGANATILPGLTLGKFCMIGAGAVVTKSVMPYSIVAGNPAKVIGRVNHD